MRGRPALAEAELRAHAGSLQFHLLSFEGPDPYARAGGIASRIEGLSRSLADAGHETHLWFVGDPRLPGHESRASLHLHRWCQWISGHHPLGVYDGEEGKERDYAASLPPFLLREWLGPHLSTGREAVVLAEEWHTASAVKHLDWLLRQAGLRSGVCMLWNANNTFGFERIDWERLRAAAVITTVSRYMRHRMGEQGVDALVIPNGLSAEAFLPAEPGAVTSFRKRLQGRTVLAKMARFDPEKRWLGALEIVGQLARAGLRPLLVARGGAEQHGADVLRRARALGLRVRERATSAPGTAGLLSLLGGLESTDVVFIGSHVDPEARRLLFRAAHAVLANSAHEPFGLVGLEAMAAGGLAVTGCTGEDYAVSGQNALVLQTEDAREFVTLFGELRRNPDAGDEIRRAGQRTAREFAWSRVIERNLIPRVELLRAAAQAA